MTLAVVVPCDNFNILRGEGKDLVPAVVPQEIGRKDPVLAVGDLGAEMGGEPRRCGCRGSCQLKIDHCMYGDGLASNVGFALEGAQVGMIAIRHR